MAIKKIDMPRRHDGTRIPNPTRYLCNYGHLHPSFSAALKCHTKRRKETTP